MDAQPHQEKQVAKAHRSYCAMRDAILVALSEASKGVPFSQEAYLGMCAALMDIAAERINDYGATRKMFVKMARDVWDDRFGAEDDGQG